MWLKAKNVFVNSEKAPAIVMGGFLVVTICAIGLFTGLLLWNLKVRELEHSRVETVSIAQMFVEQTEKSLNTTELLLSNVQEKLQDEFGRRLSLGSFPVHFLLTTRAAGRHQIKSIFVVDADGNVLNSSHDLEGKLFVGDREYFRVYADGSEQRTYISKPIRNRIDNSWTLYVSKKLTDEKGAFKGVLAVAIDIASMEQIYNFMKLDFLRPIALYTLDGTLVASLPHREGMIGAKVPEIAEDELAQASREIKLIHHASGDGAKSTFAIGRVPSYPLFVTVTSQDDEALSSWRESAIPIGIGSAGTCVFIVVVGALLIRKLLREAELSGELQNTKDKYQHTIDSVMDAIIAVNEDYELTLFNPASEVMFGYSAREVLGKQMVILMPERFRSMHGVHMTHFIRSPSDATGSATKSQLKILGLRKNGEEFPIESTIAKTQIGDTVQLTAVLRDVTQRVMAEADLRKTNQQLRELSSSLQTVREVERKRISRELHDDLGQQLTGLKLDLSWLSNRLKDGREVQLDRVAEMKSAIDVAISSVRRISTELRPVMLDDLGFTDAIRWLVDETSKRSGIKMSLKLDQLSDAINQELATSLYRIIQESLNNIIKHAQATEVAIELKIFDGRLFLTVGDNGVGLPDDLNSGGVGLVGMRERTLAHGGEFSIESSLGQGALVKISMPAILQQPFEVAA
jgi:PAS domain S-box-containing protein